MHCKPAPQERDDEKKKASSHAPRVVAQLAIAAAIAAMAHLPARAQNSGSLLDLSLEQLANIEVTSVSKRPQRLADVAASVYVIANDEIRRSGATSVTEALRLAPNLHVARADANQYAISARGFNSVLANKMLVLVDGRTVYSPLFSGVFWEERDIMIEDVDRIEVLSGSGGTLYGSNAVNGVINIITRSAADTQGTLLSATVGQDDRQVAGRYGATTPGGIAYRAYAKRTLRDNTSMAGGVAIRDEATLDRAGFRADGSAAQGSQWTLQGDIYDGRIDQAPAARTIRGGNVLARWTGDHASGGRTQVQAYADRSERNQPGAIRDSIDTLDLDVQHLSRTWKDHELLVGGGVRWQRDTAENIAPAALGFLPAGRQLNLANVFAQDEIALSGSFKLTLGAKLERNAYTGVEFLPNARVAWNVAPNHLVWAAASRTVRAPSRVDREFFSPVAPPFAFAGGPNFVSEVARVFEAGYRAQPTASVSLSATVFHHHFDKLRSVDAGPGGLTINNNFTGRLNGLEAWASYRVSDSWRVKASTTQLRETIEALPGTTPFNGTAQLANDPRSRWTLTSAWDLRNGHEFDVMARHSSALPNPVVPAYTAIDARWGWHVSPAVQVSLTVRNLNDRRHVEWGTSAARAELTRSAIAKVTWRL